MWVVYEILNKNDAANSCAERVAWGRKDAWLRGVLRVERQRFFHFLSRLRKCLFQSLRFLGALFRSEEGECRRTLDEIATQAVDFFKQFYIRCRDLRSPIQRNLLLSGDGSEIP